MNSESSDHSIPVPHTRPPLASSFSLPAVLSLVGGMSLLSALQVNEALVQTWPVGLRTVLALIGIGLIVFALLSLVIQFIRVRRGTAHRRRRIGFTNLPREGAAYLLIMIVMAAGSLLGRSNLLMLVFAMMAGPFVMNGWVVSAMLTRLRVKRILPRRATAGEPVIVEIELTNKKRRLTSRLIVVKDEMSNGPTTLKPTTLFVSVAPGRQRRCSYKLRLTERGRYQLGSLSVSSHYPLGLVERGRFFPADAEILVHPHLGYVRRALWHGLTDASELAERSRGRNGIFDDEFHRIREFRDGDNPRAIHWRSTARQNELMVREFEQSRDQNLVVLLELNATTAEKHELELAISFVASMLVDHARNSREAQLALFVAGRRVQQVEGPVSPHTLEQMLDVLAEVQPGSCAQADVLLDESRSARQRAGTRVVMLATDEADSSGISAASAGNFRLIPVSEAGIAPYFDLPPLADDVLTEQNLPSGDLKPVPPPRIIPAEKSAAARAEASV